MRTEGSIRTLRGALRRVPGVVPLYARFLALRNRTRLRRERRKNPGGRLVVCNGVEVFCDFRNETSMWYVGEQGNLRLDQAILARLLPMLTGNVFVDVGAHFGFFSRYLADLAWGRHANSRLIAIEPDALNFQCLEKTLQSFEGQGRALLINAAVGDSDGSLTLYESPGAPCAHTYGGDGASPTGAVQAYRLDTLIERHLAATDRVALVKIDVDGAEPSVVKGAAHTLERHRPLLLMEFAPKCLLEGGTNPRAFYEQLCERYAVYWISYTDRAVRKVDVRDYNDVAAGTGDAVSDFIVSTNGPLPEPLLPPSN